MLCRSEILTNRYPQTGPNGEDLYTDVVRIGSSRPDRILIVISGTHGVEGFCGSACQTEYLKSECAARIGEQTAIYLVHGLNPYGFSWLRRVTHENVDLNRNFVEFENRSLPQNSGYATLFGVLNPLTREPETLDEPDPNIKAWFASPEKIAAFKAAVGKGQYDYPHGIIFGGTSATWCNRVLRDFVAALPRTVKHGAVLDFHTGLGERGGLEIFCEDKPDSTEFRRCAEWYAGHTVTSLGDAASVGYEITGSIFQAFTRSQRSIQWTCADLEFGTENLVKVLLALQADNWLHCFSQGVSPLAPRIQEMMRASFSPEANEWQAIVLQTGTSIIRQALTALNDLRL